MAVSPAPSLHAVTAGSGGGARVDRETRMMVVAPHPDDETLGCGGTILRQRAAGGQVDWLLVTGISEAHGWSREVVERREREIEQVREAYGFASLLRLEFPTTKLDELPVGALVSRIAEAIRSSGCTDVLMPFRHDVHSDHRVTATAVLAAVKAFRQPSVRRVLMYETLSETEFGFPADAFHPNVFVEIGPYMQRKLEIFSYYRSEVMAEGGARSLSALEALAKLRGARMNRGYAEAFELVFELA